MSFADPHHCPGCGGPIAGEDRCPACGFRLTSPEARKLWQVLLSADSLLEDARRASVDEPVSHAAAGPMVPTERPLPQPPESATPQRRTPQLSTGSVILGLGALFLIVAAIVFISVSWDVLGATGRTLVLLVITGAIAGVATWSTRRRLRASAEAMWTVFFGFFAIDYFAARSYGLLGLDSLDWDHAVLVFGIVTAVLGVAVALAGRRFLLLRAPSLAGGLAVWVASISVVGVLDGPFFWRVLAGLALAGAATGIAGLLSLRLLMVTSGTAAGAFFVAGVLAAIDDLAEHPNLDQLAQHGLPMLVMAAVAAGMGLAVNRLRLPAAGFATLAIASLVFTPSIAASTPEGGYLAAAGLAVLLAVGLIRGSGEWKTGARISGGLILLGLGLASLGWFSSAVESILPADADLFAEGWAARLIAGADRPGPAWVAAITFLAIAVATYAVLRWPECREYARPLQPAPVFFGMLGAGVTVVAAEPPAILAAAIALALGTGLLFLSRPSHQAWQALAFVLVVIPAAMAVISRSATLTIWIAVAVVLGAVAVLWTTDWLRRASAFGSTVLVLGSVAIGSAQAGLGDPGTRIAALIASIIALALGSFILRGFVARSEVEIAGGLGIVAVLISAVDEGLAAQALLWTIAGACTVVIGLLTADRGRLRYVGSGALGVAWVLRLLASDVNTIEAYTAPFAVVLLAAGLGAMRGDTDLGTVRALGPGLSLALLPSLPLALNDPTGLRALLLGIVAFITLVNGMWQKWQMPFLSGSAVLILLVVWNVGPVANGLPRWFLIAAAGAVFTGFGITWESRVGNARSAAQYVRNLR